MEIKIKKTAKKLKKIKAMNRQTKKETNEFLQHSQDQVTDTVAHKLVDEEVDTLRLTL